VPLYEPSMDREKEERLLIIPRGGCKNESQERDGGRKGEGNTRLKSFPSDKNREGKKNPFF